ncbi:hypothetical protein BU23DRAFT_142684 [Bimuria novae-zelandiae CBS 107.79]|uniref:RING-type domain-containing protein n=1 Tax=Bimuria novae-zelandiae CBS 107.79 TaxID=1447943 RepID=A0A6A5V9U8_9PLEO|nr:hypothetical protein BU23DRAFT_142684 [Bimuria novae-zelandiae CBS 107.79]
MFNPSAQSLAAAALSYLPRPSGPLMPHYRQPARASDTPNYPLLLQNTATGQQWQYTPTDSTRAMTPASPTSGVTQPANQPSIDPDDATRDQNSSLPSLLRYVDNELLRRRAEWNKPPVSNIICYVCYRSYYDVPYPSDYLPLTCGCWMHYRCFIDHVVTDRLRAGGREQDCCPICGTRLFVLEGIVQFTLAMRTNLTMWNKEYLAVDYYWDEHTGKRVVSDATAYAADCLLIENMIQTQLAIFKGLSHSPYSDNSPDLRTCYYAILADLDKHRCPRSRWLSFNRATVSSQRYSSVGFFLFGMLVMLKMRRLMMENHPGIVETEGWADYENSREELQGMILKEVRGDGWSWSTTAAATSTATQSVAAP